MTRRTSYGLVVAVAMWISAEGACQMRSPAECERESGQFINGVCHYTLRDPLE
jgi:hypothetical protein